MLRPSPNPKTTRESLKARVAEMPVAISLPDLAALATFDLTGLADLVDGALGNASAEAVAAIQRSLDERRPDLDGGLSCVDIDVSRARITVRCEMVELLTVERGTTP